MGAKILNRNAVPSVGAGAASHGRNRVAVGALGGMMIETRDRRPETGDRIALDFDHGLQDFRIPQTGLGIISTSSSSSVSILSSVVLFLFLD